MEQDIKKLLDEKEKNILQQMGVLIEGVNDNIKHIAEHHTSMREDITDIKADVSDMKEEVIEINVRIGHIEDNLRRKVDYEEFEKLEKRVGVLEQKFVS